MTVIIPITHCDLLEKPLSVAFSTVMPDGTPQTTVVWCSYDGTYVYVNTMRGFRKEQNMRANPKVTLLAYEGHIPDRYLEIRGLVVDMTEDGALEHLDKLALAYTGKAPYFGAVVPSSLREQQIPVLCKIDPLRIVAALF